MLNIISPPKRYVHRDGSFDGASKGALYVEWDGWVAKLVWPNGRKGECPGIGKHEVAHFVEIGWWVEYTAVTKEDVNGEEHVDEQGRKWWMGTLVHPCPACGVAPTNVDDCGHFGDPMCPYFGVGRPTSG